MIWTKLAHAGWFGAGLSTAAVGAATFQLLSGTGLPGPQPPLVATATGTNFPTRTPFPTRTAFPTRTVFPTRTAFPTRTVFPTRTAAPGGTPYPTHTPYATRTPRPFPTPTPELVAPDLLATLTLAEPDRVVAAVATFAARTSAALATPPQR